MASTITANTSSQNKNEPVSGTNPVEAVFNLSSPLTFFAKLALKIVPSGAEYGSDYNNFKASYSLSPSLTGASWVEISSFLPIPANDGTGTVSGDVFLPPGTKFIKLMADVLPDLIIENGEGFQFVVAQEVPSVDVLSGSYVTSMVRLSDPVVTAAKISVKTDDSFSGTPNIPTYTSANATSIAENDAVAANTALASFKLDRALEVASEVSVSIVGSGADASDYSGFMYSVHYQDGSNSGGLVVPNDGKIILQKDAIFFRLATTLVNDHNSETGESITFVVSQSATAVGLKDSYYVQKTFNIIDGPQTFISTIVKNDFTATSAVDTFVVNSNMSVINNDVYDIITGFSTTGQSDVIKLGVSIGSPSFTAAKFRVLTANQLDESSLVAILKGLDGLDVSAGTATPDDYKGLTFVFKTGSDAYLLFDSDYDGKVDTGSTGGDTFIKIVGGAGLDYTQNTNDFAAS